MLLGTRHLIGRGRAVLLKRKKPKPIVLALLFSILLSGCTPAVPPITLAPTLTPSPSSRRMATPTRQATPTPTPTATSTPRPSPSPSPTPQTYVVRKGDVLGRIARDWNVTLSSLIEANGIEDPSRLSIGQVLVIPPPTEAPKAAQGTDGTPRPTFTPSPTASPIPSEHVVYITATGNEYHREGCPELGGQGLPITCREAVALGYRRCKVCQPDCW